MELQYNFNKNNRLKAALLPMYLALYDQSFPEMRPRIDSFLHEITERLEKNGITLIKLPVCRIREEFEQAINRAENEEAHAIITLHLAYSPSLESIDVLTGTKLPVIVMNTTPTYSFDSLQDPDEIMYNHGIHGVQDMCNLLDRNKKHFVIESGHIDHSDIIDRITAHMMSAKMASAMKNGRSGRIGDQFAGMGDFAVEPELLETTLGTSVIQADLSDVAIFLPDENDPEIEAEIEEDNTLFNTDNLDPSIHRQSVMNGLALRRWIEKEKLTAFSLNFSNIDRENSLSVMPFLEISKLMARGIGYAGEGDLLTASLVGALFSVLKDVSFIEMFCPDWKNETVFLSHMGEMNLNLSAGRPNLITMPWRFSDTNSPVIATGCFKQGDAVFVNLAPCGNNSYSLFVAPVTMLPEESGSRFTNNIRGWMKPAIPLTEFLEVFSRKGGTHHSALVYNAAPDIILEFGKMMGWRTHLISKQ
ncbi:MAG: hypothetical protein ABFS38_11995 [Bacteroidota bacterium]